MKKIIALIAIALLGGTIFLGSRSMVFNNTDNEQFQAKLWRLRHLDTAFNEEVLKARFALLDNYDDADSYIKELDDIVAALKEPPAFIDPTGRKSIENACVDYRAILSQREEIYERFKSRNALLANSSRYLPTALDDFATRLGDSPSDKDLESAINDLTRLMLMRLASPAESADQAEPRLTRIKDWCALHREHPQAKFVSTLVRHAQIIASGHREVDALTRQLVALPGEAVIHDLFQAYETDMAKAFRRAQEYRAMFCLLALITFVGVGYSIWALRDANRRLEQRVEVRTRELATSEERFRLILSNVKDYSIIMLRPDGCVGSWNAGAERITGFTDAEIVGQHFSKFYLPEDIKRGRPDRELSVAAREGRFEAEGSLLRKDGSEYIVNVIINSVRDKAGKLIGFVKVACDITERKESEKKHQLLEVQLRQIQKLEAVGRLAAGIAHEINTPAQFIGDNLHFVRDVFPDIIRVLQSHGELLEAAKSGAVTPELLSNNEALLAASGLKYIIENVPASLNEAIEGVERVAKIVRAMKEFSHPGQKGLTATDLNHCIQSTVIVAGSEWKFVAEMKLELAADLPSVACFPDEINQCILNLIVNAAHAIGDVVSKTPGAKGLITVRTLKAGNQVEIRVQDTGTGIPEEVRPRIFDPFFTTKEVGKGTGQGLSIIYCSVVKRHGGTVTFETETGRGTTFIIRLPVAPARDPKVNVSLESSLLLA